MLPFPSPVFLNQQRSPWESYLPQFLGTLLMNKIQHKQRLENAEVATKRLEAMRPDTPQGTYAYLEGDKWVVKNTPETPEQKESTIKKAEARKLSSEGVLPITEYGYPSRPGEIAEEDVDTPNRQLPPGQLVRGPQGERRWKPYSPNELKALREQQTSDYQNYQNSVRGGYKGLFDDWLIRNKKAGAASTSVSIGPRAFTKMGEKMGESIVEEYNTAKQSITSLQDLTEAEKLLKGRMITGFGAEGLKEIGKGLQLIGVNLAPDAIANTEAYAATMGKQVGQIIKQFGAGTGLSDADREYAEKMAGGKITLTKQAIEQILSINKKALRNIVTNYNNKAKKIMSKPESSELPYSLILDVPQGLLDDSKPPLDSYFSR